MVKKDTVKSISLFLNGVVFASLFFGMLWADSNGVWTLAQDIKGGIIGADEQVPNMNYSFINPVYFNNSVYFNKKLKTNDSNYYINISGRTQLNDLATQKIASNYVNINGNLYVRSNLTLENITNCNGKLYTDLTGKVLCGIDNVNDGDSNPTNELQTISKSGSTVILSKGGGSINVNDGDSSPTNELQTISKSGSTVTLSKGGGSININDGDSSPTNELQNLYQVLSRGNNGGGYRITNIANPVSNQDVATKSYVDSKNGDNCAVCGTCWATQSHFSNSGYESYIKLCTPSGWVTTYDTGPNSGN